MRSLLFFCALGMGSFCITLEFLALRALIVVVEPSRVIASPVFLAPAEARFLFVGDMMFDRSIRAHLDRSSSEALFGAVVPLLHRVDFVAGNLEGPITSHASVSVETRVGDRRNTQFTFAPSATTTLGLLGVDLVSVGNNHITDFGREGVASTETALAEAGILHVGNPFATTTEPVMESVRGITVAFTTYNEFIRPSASSTQEAIARARSAGADFVVVMAHWGDEYEREPPARIRRLAQVFSDSGADLIVGTHSHVIGAWEDVGKTRVYYSLGNFIFDQYWDESVRCGLGVEVMLRKGEGEIEVEYMEHHTHLERDGSTTLLCPDLPFQTQDKLN
jgi:gamma-polyglutamate biosynthesis protein CapA